MFVRHGNLAVAAVWLLTMLTVILPAYEETGPMIMVAARKASGKKSAAQTSPSARFAPVHPRVNINWTEGIIKSNLTQDELDRIEQDELVLTKLVVINRHGHRAPNAPYWKMCPNDRRNQRHYDVNAEDLTALGMQQEFDFGVYLRTKYHSFLGYHFNRTLHFFRAVGEPRILQSAAAVARGVFPDGYGPDGFLAGRPQFVPIFSDMDTHEYLLDNVPCFKRAEADSRRWIAENYNRFVGDPQVADVLSEMQYACGVYDGKASAFSYIKTVADGLTFNNDLGLPLVNGKISAKLLLSIRNMSLQLFMQRLYNTDEQQTYTAVDLPRTLLQTLNHTHLGDDVQVNNYRDTRQEATFYFVHREALYALGQFFGFEYVVPGIPHGELPAASALIIEKLMPRRNIYSHDESKVYVRLTLWTPLSGTATVPIMSCRIPELCEMREFRNIYHKRTSRTGTWEQLCNYAPQELDHTTDIR